MRMFWRLSSSEWILSDHMKKKNLTVDHIGIATKSLMTLMYFGNAWICSGTDDEIVEEQGVKVRYLSSPNSDLDDTRIELLEPMGMKLPLDGSYQKEVLEYNKFALELRT